MWLRSEVSDNNNQNTIIMYNYKVYPLVDAGTFFGKTICFRWWGLGRGESMSVGKGTLNNPANLAAANAYFFKIKLTSDIYIYIVTS